MGINFVDVFVAHSRFVHDLFIFFQHWNLANQGFPQKPIWFELKVDVDFLIPEKYKNESNWMTLEVNNGSFSEEVIIS